MSQSQTGSPGIWNPGEPGQAAQTEPSGHTKPKSLSKPRGIIMILLVIVMLSPFVCGALVLALSTLMVPGEAGALAQQEFLDGPGGGRVPNPDFSPVQEFYGDAVFVLSLVAMTGVVTVPVAFIALIIVGITSPAAVRVVKMPKGTPVEPGDIYQPQTWYSGPATHYRPSANIPPPAPEKVAAAKVLSRAALYRLAVAACVVLGLVAAAAVILT